MQNRREGRENFFLPETQVDIPGNSKILIKGIHLVATIPGVQRLKFHLNEVSLDFGL